MTDPKFDAAGLVPVIVQDRRTRDVLMVAHMNREAYDRTRETCWLHLYSRTRQAQWLKGETSGNRMRVVSWKLDCDADSLLVLVDPEGPACHTGEVSCFFHDLAPPAGSKELAEENAPTSSSLAKLVEVLKDRHAHPVEGSYTSYLFEKGLDKILKKIGEEATEVVIAAKNQDPAPLVGETADLMYHLLVLLVERRIDLSRVYRELESRAGTPRTKPLPRGDRSRSDD